ncbi:Serine-threonine/tyrosine-protein kinase, catalytic domain [Sesbania bispinosa]|nr:Serine-threonine/tyrosine-protein kinase, catalytic domain [Sesbania bispinosa]
MDEEVAMIRKRFGDEQSTLLDQFERLSFESHLNKAMLQRSLSEPGLPRSGSQSRLLSVTPTPTIPLVTQVKQGRCRGSGGAAVGAVFGELLKAVLEIRDKAVMFKQTLANLRSTLITVAPIMKEIEQHNIDLGRPKEDLESLIREMEEGTNLVSKCAKIHRLNFMARARYQERLEALMDSLVRFFIIDMQAQATRDQKETLLKVRKILSAVNKFPMVNAEDTTVSSSYFSAVSLPGDMETNYSEEAMEHIIAVNESDSETPHSTAEQAMEPLTSIADESKAKAEHNQGMNEKSYEQAAERRFFGIRLPNIDLEDLIIASDEVLGKGSYGHTYKAILEDGRMVVVKRLKKAIEKTEFQREVKVVHMLSSEHPNVIPLRAYYYHDHEGEKLLIYDYIMAGSLSRFLQAHVSANPPESEGYCYRAPEVVETGQLTQKCDVYSFGVILCEMLNDVEPPRRNLCEVLELVQRHGRWTPPDSACHRYIRRHEWDMWTLAVNCVAREPERRPSMAEVVKNIQSILDENSGFLIYDHFFGNDKELHLLSNWDSNLQCPIPNPINIITPIPIRKMLDRHNNI